MSLYVSRSSLRVLVPPPSSFYRLRWGQLPVASQGRSYRAMIKRTFYLSKVMLVGMRFGRLGFSGHVI
jgi:hypothetical protein